MLQWLPISAAWTCYNQRHLQFFLCYTIQFLANAVLNGHTKWMGKGFGLCNWIWAEFWSFFHLRDIPFDTLSPFIHLHLSVKLNSLKCYASIPCLDHCKCLDYITSCWSGFQYLKGEVAWMRKVMSSRVSSQVGPPATGLWRLFPMQACLYFDLRRQHFDGWEFEFAK